MLVGGSFQGDSLSFDPEVSGPKGRMLPYELAGHAGHAGLADDCFSLFQSSCDTSYAVHNNGDNDLQYR